MMVALVAGILVSMAAFLLARNASSFFQNEVRISSAQFASMIGLTRLRSDLRRANMMSSANVNTDPFLCGKNGNWPAGLNDLAGITIEKAGSVKRHPGDHTLTTESLFNKLSPDAVIIGGLFGTTEHFSVQTLVAGQGGGFDIYLQMDGAYRRTQAASQVGQPVLDRIFKVGRFLRIVDGEGKVGFGVITGLNEGGPVPRVSVAASPALPRRETHKTCGCEGWCTGALVNPVARVLYDLRTIDPGKYKDYAGLYPKIAPAAGHKGAVLPKRTELVRIELNQTGAEIPDTLELVSEYAVDLKFGITVQTPGGPPNNVPTLERHAIGVSKVYDEANLNTGRPERVTGVQVRLSVRAPRSDRQVVIPPPADGGLYRFYLGKNQGFARVRTLVADVHLSNQASVSWP